MNKNDKISNTVYKFINKHKLFTLNDKLLIGVSGGSDSIFLCEILYRLNYDISLAHFNFQLRGKESDQDEAFVKNYANDKNIPIFINNENTKEFATKCKLSIQESARILRYDWFNWLKEKKGFNNILTAHHADDNVETMLYNFIRGSGLKGIKGMPIINKSVVRPLLCLSKQEILTYLNNNKISYRDDKSNDDTKYKRNFIRHQLLPLISEINPSYLKTLSNSSNIFRSEYQYLEDKLIRDTQKAMIKKNKDAIHFSIKTILKSKAPDILIHYILDKHGYSQDQKNNILNALNKKISGLTFITKKTKLYIERDEIILAFESYIPHKHTINEVDSELNINGLKLNFKVLDNTSKLTFKNDVEYLDYDKLSFPLTLRNWKNGDYFYPLGLNKKKKIKKYFSDQKVSNFDKKHKWILLSGSKIAYIVNERIDHRFSITEKTKRILEIKHKKT